MSEIRVVVCGLPRSGNRLVQRLLQRHGFIAEVRHYGMEKAFRPGGFGDRAILPLRELGAHRLSAARDRELLPKANGAALPDPQAMHFAHFWPMLRYCATHRIPVLPVIYEQIVESPDEIGSLIVRFAAQDWAAEFNGWGEKLIDGNAKWAGSS